MTLLEIVVPTYNRANILERTLHELYSAILFYKDFVSIRVIDNCSSDHTQKVSEKFSQHNGIVYQRNLENIGLIRNIAKCINSSSAEWVWIFGDDDHILIHCLPRLIDSLQKLPNDVVFARGLAAKANDCGCVTYSEPCGECMHPVLVHNSGIHITSNRSIHDLAFISQLFIRPRFWNHDYFNSIYNDTDLYTFVFVLLRECISLKTAELNFHVVVATDRGDRSYYTTNMCIARLTEYTNYETLVHKSVGRRKAIQLLRKGRKNMLKLRIASSFKLLGFHESFRIFNKCPIIYMKNYRSPYSLDVLVIRSLAILASLPGMQRLFGYIYMFLQKRS